jgi:hypothetical protein
MTRSFKMHDLAGVATWLTDLYPDTPYHEHFEGLHRHLTPLLATAARAPLPFSPHAPRYISAAHLSGVLCQINRLAHDAPLYDSLPVTRQLTTLRDHVLANY